MIVHEQDRLPRRRHLNRTGRDCRRDQLPRRRIASRWPLRVDSPCGWTGARHGSAARRVAQTARSSAGITRSFALARADERGSDPLFVVCPVTLALAPVLKPISRAQRAPLDARPSLSARVWSGCRAPREHRCRRRRRRTRARRAAARQTSAPTPPSLQSRDSSRPSRHPASGEILRRSPQTPRPRRTGSAVPPA